MNTIQQITLGPFFATAPHPDLACKHIRPLNLVVEWSSPQRATRIHLFRFIPPSASAHVRLEHVLFRQTDLPFDIECPADQVIDSSEGTFLPLDALLTALYRAFGGPRSIPQLLNELAAIVPLHSPLTKPIVGLGLLKPEVEAMGFRLNSFHPIPGQVWVQFGWQPASSATRFHVCVAVLSLTRAKQLNTGEWMTQREMGTYQLLDEDLHRLFPGSPMRLLSASGIQMLRESILRTGTST